MIQSTHEMLHADSSATATHHTRSHVLSTSKRNEIHRRPRGPTDTHGTSVAVNTQNLHAAWQTPVQAVSKLCVGETDRPAPTPRSEDRAESPQSLAAHRGRRRGTLRRREAHASLAWDVHDHTPILPPRASRLNATSSQEKPPIGNHPARDPVQAVHRRSASWPKKFSPEYVMYRKPSASWCWS